MKVASEPFASIILVNYNGWQDTIECLESLLKIDYAHYNIVVVDNASTDSSIQSITAWAKGDISYDYNKSTLSAKFTFPPALKPVVFAVHDANNFEPSVIIKKQITLIKSQTNLGFAGGNNAGTRFMMSLSEQPDFYWYLNNDTVVEKCSLTKLVASFQKHLASGVKLGIMGSKLKYYHKPNTIQAIGALYNPWSATVKHVGHNEIDQGQYDKSPEKVHLDYIVGASMYISKNFLEEVGLMSEDYFLYYEEIDWIIRGKRKGFTFTYCAECIVYHKEGASIGANNLKKTKSTLSDYYDIRNRLLITRKYFAKYLPSIYLSMFLVIINRIRRGHFDRIPYILRLIFSKG